MENWTEFEVIIENCNERLSQYQGYDPATNTCHWRPLKVCRAIADSSIEIDLPNRRFHYFCDIKAVDVKDRAVIIESDDGRIYTITGH